MNNRYILLISIIVLLLGCVSSSNSKVDLENFGSTINRSDMFNLTSNFNSLNNLYKKIESEVEFEIEVDDLSQLIQADLYFNQGDYSVATTLYVPLAYKYQYPDIIYKAIICEDYLSLNSNYNNSLQLRNLMKLFIQVSPNSNLSQLFRVIEGLYSNQANLAERNLAILLANNKKHGRDIFLYLSVSVYNNMLNFNQDVINKFAKYVSSRYAIYPEANLLAIICFALSNDISGMVTRLTYIEKNYPQWPWPFYLMVEILNTTHHSSDIIKVLEYLIKSSMRSSILVQNLYIIALINNNQLKAAKDYAQIYLLGPDRNNALINLGIIALKESDYSQAIKYFNEVNANDFRIKNAILLIMATINELQGNYKDAIKDYGKLVNKAELLTNFINAVLLENYYNLGEYKKIDQLLNQIAKLDNLDEKQTLLLYSSYYMSINQYDKAYKILKTKFAKYRNDNEYFYQYISALAFTEDAITSIPLYKEYIKREPKLSVGYNDLAYIYAEKTKNYKIAKQYALKALALSPTNPNVLDTVGWVYYKLGKYSKAYPYIKNAYDATLSPECGEHLKAVYLALNELDLAKKVVIMDNKQLKLKARQDMLQKYLNLLIFLQYGVNLE